MKKLLTALFILIGFNLVAQQPTNYTPINSKYKLKAGAFDSALHIPTGCGYPSLLTTYSWKGGAALYGDTCNNKLYFYRDTAWVYIPDSSFVLSNVVDTANKFVNLIQRTAGKDSIIFWIGGTRYAIKDSTGGGSTPTLQQVLDAGSTLTSSESIDVGANTLSVIGTATTGVNSFSVSNSSSGNSISANSYNGSGYALYALTNNATAIYAYAGTGVPGLFALDQGSTNSLDTLLTLRRKSSGTAANGIGGYILFETQDANSVTLGTHKIAAKLSTAAAATKTSEFDFLGLDAASEETFMNIQKDLVRINNNADTLATKAYARSVGGSGGTNNANVGSGYRVLKPGTQEIKTLFNGYAIGIDSSSNTDGLTFKADTSYNGLETKLDNRRKLDSILAVKQNTLKLGNDFTMNVDSLFLKGAWVNIKDFGAVGDGTTNCNAALSAAIATGKNIFIPAGRYLITVSKQLQAGQMIFGVGYNSVFVTTANDRILQTNDNTTITGLRFKGDGKSAGKTFQTGIFLYQSIKFDISHCWFDSISGAAQQNGGGGIYGALMNAGNSAGGRISNCTFYNNNGGLVLSQRAEYVTISNITCENNTVGLGIGAGNITVSGAIIENNRTGVLVYEGTNDGHGSIADALINHNDTSIAVRWISHDVGFMFNTCHVYYGKISLLNSSNIKFVNTQFDFIDSVSINGSTSLQRTACFWGRNNSGGYIPVNVYNGGEDFSTLGEVRYTNSTANYWIKQQKADTVSLAGQLITTNRILQNQGADVASVAGAIALGNDGNTFEITGTNAITLISNVGWQNGAEITLIFTSTATLTDGTANSSTNIGMELAGNANFSATADDVIKLVLCEIGGTQRWREVSRSVN